MSRPSLSHLYFESVSVSKIPLKWLLCASFIHAGLFCIPAGSPKPSKQGIVFRQGNAGVEVELTLEPSDSARDFTKPSRDLPQDSAEQIQEPRPIVSEAEFPAPAEPISPQAPVKTKTHRNIHHAVAAAPSAGSAISQPAAEIYTSQPPYPPRAREAGAEGVVRLQVRIGVDGRPREVKIVRPSGRSDFDFSSVHTVERDWRFRPARTSTGTAVESTIVVAIKFDLKS